MAAIKVCGLADKIREEIVAKEGSVVQLEHTLLSGEEFVPTTTDEKVLRKRFKVIPLTHERRIILNEIVNDLKSSIAELNSELDD